MAAVGWLWFAAVAAIVIGVSITDCKRRLVANEAAVALTALAAGLVGFGDAIDAVIVDRWVAVAAAFGVFAVGLVIYAAGLVGAGDVKLLLPVALIMVRLDAAAWLWYLAVLIVAATATLVSHVIQRRGDDPSLPMAPVLTLGLIPAVLSVPPSALFP